MMLKKAREKYGTTADDVPQSSGRVPAEQSRDWECSICTSSNQTKVSLGCGHVMCDHCAIRSIENQQKCPFCQRAASEEDIRRIFWRSPSIQPKRVKNRSIFFVFRFGFHFDAKHEVHMTSSMTSLMKTIKPEPTTKRETLSRGEKPLINHFTHFQGLIHHWKCQKWLLSTDFYLGFESYYKFQSRNTFWIWPGYFRTNKVPGHLQSNRVSFQLSYHSNILTWFFRISFASYFSIWEAAFHKTGLFLKLKNFKWTIFGGRVKSPIFNLKWCLWLSITFSVHNIRFLRFFCSYLL